MKRIFLCALIVGLFAISNLANAVLNVKDDDLLLYLPFNGDTDDLSNKANHGEIAGNLDYTDEGKFGQAMLFEASGEVKCPYIELNDRSFTMCMWVKAKREGADQQCVMSQIDTNATNTSLHYRIYSGNGNVRMGFYSNDLDAPNAAPADEWIHIAFWFDGDDLSRKIYINGEEAISAKAPSAYKGMKGNTVIGSWDTSGQRFDGVIDEVQIWGRALTEAEIEQSMEDLIVSSAVDASGKLTATWGSVKDSF